MENEKYLFVVSGPSGVGKDTVVATLRGQYPEIGKTVSATTRAPRPGERDGVDYFFCTREDFERRMQKGEIVEYNVYGGNYYGTLRSEVDRNLAAGTFVVLVIDVHGAANIKRQYPGCTTVFLLPPSAQVLEQRLRGRGTEDEASVQRRLDEARAELARAPEFDRQLVNQEVAACAGALYALMAGRAQTA